jgi:MoaA/NifB/PqqE/SkfB family radical SAM enzyme
MKETPNRIKLPNGYCYFNILKNHLIGDLTKIFNGELIYPRQLEIHLPGDHKRACNFNCYYCQGRFLEQSLSPYEDKAIKLLHELEGKIPYMIYGGAYSEPLLNPELLKFLWLTKKYGSFFGIHTNGSFLKKLEEENGFLSELCRLATSQEDYLSITLDAGRPESHMRAKNLKQNYFDVIIKGIRRAVTLRGKSDAPAIRVCYLLNRFNSSQEEIEGIIATMKDIGVDSLRFSIPYDHYGKDFCRVREYKAKVEIRQHNRFQIMLAPLISETSEEKPFIFYLPPEYQDVEKMNFRQCIYCYYQLTLGADGYVYRCSSTATPSFSMNRLGEVPDNLPDFNEIILAAQNPNFVPSVCFSVGARCNRMALEINLRWKEISGSN